MHWLAKKNYYIIIIIVNHIYHPKGQTPCTLHLTYPSTSFKSFGVNLQCQHLKNKQGKFENFHLGFSGEFELGFNIRMFLFRVLK